MPHSPICPPFTQQNNETHALNPTELSPREREFYNQLKTEVGENIRVSLLTWHGLLTCVLARAPLLLLPFPPSPPAHATTCPKGSAVPPVGCAAGLLACFHSASIASMLRLRSHAFHMLPPKETAVANYYPQRKQQ